MRLLALILALYGAFYLGTTKAPQHRLEGTPWCFHSEYNTIKDYSSTKGVAHAMVDVTNKGVKVYAKCDAW